MGFFYFKLTKFIQLTNILTVLGLKNTKLSRKNCDLEINHIENGIEPGIMENIIIHLLL